MCSLSNLTVPLLLWVAGFNRWKAFSPIVLDGFFRRTLDSIQFPFMERRHGDICARGLYWVTMDTEEELTHVIDKVRLLNNKDEAFGLLCLSISRDLLFHLLGLKTPKEIWDKLETLYGKQDDLRVYQLENELMSLQPSNFETLNDFFTKFKHIVWPLKQCKVEKEDDQLIPHHTLQTWSWLFSVCLYILCGKYHKPWMEDAFTQRLHWVPNKWTW